ncbi:RDD family protein [Aerolutibacter ruishenii]|uniref:Putative RDD family membrane protein YckC n=1 Tax=Aerolutibacter ruishenii TaxID=686800 RepID=A0A562LXZ4_9GAMM|nr:RDD family protein [Lysobacter ruishenii]TWI12519.1 putative RDD family membrane protein YckC [Lysobacter ruishenii]
MEDSSAEYVGFWPRVGATIIDSIIMLVITSPLMIAIYGGDYFTGNDLSLVRGPADFLVTWVLPAVATILFWMYKQATPGKLAVSARVVDARTGNPLTLGQSIIRYLGYFVSMLPLFLGIIWVAFDPRKQGWHDKLAGTVVIRPKARGVEPVRFEG